jgi:hypothetical protein
MSDQTKRLLTLGYTVGPFFVAFVIVVVMAAMGWPRTHNFGSFLVWLTPAFAGLVCLVLRRPVKGWRWIVIVPYALLCCLNTYCFSIVLMIMLGAPK